MFNQQRLPLCYIARGNPQWHRYKSRPWRRIHFPAMVLWSGAAGLETGAAQKEGREYNPDIALQYFAKALNSQLSVDDSNRFVEKIFAEYKDQQFENVIRNKLVLNSAKVSTIDAEKVIAHVIVQFKNPDLGLKARLIIAEAIKADAGEEEYIEYLRADLLPIVEALELRVFPFCSAAA